jgi:hypothetical protein
MQASRNLPQGDGTVFTMDEPHGGHCLGAQASNLKAGDAQDTNAQTTMGLLLGAPGEGLVQHGP